MKIRTLIVDDEELARERLRRLLKGEELVEVIDECTNGTDAIASILRDEPDLVFLDVHMPQCDGLGVINELSSNQRPEIIFTTAFPNFATKAFDIGVLDYLLKPFDSERLHRALRRSKHFFKQPENLESTRASLTGAGNLAFKIDSRFVFINPTEIYWIEGADNYITLHLENRRLMLRETLKAIEARLRINRFARVNRSAIVNTQHIREIRPSLHGDSEIVLQNGITLTLSRKLRGRPLAFI